MNDLQKLFLSELKDVYDAEHQIIKALPDMVKLASSDELKRAFQDHLEQSKIHARRAEEVFHEISEKPDRKTCKGMAGIIDEGQLMAKEFAKNAGLDAALIAAAQKVEHYEMATYGTLCSWAKELGFASAVSILKQTLDEEKITDEKLTRLAESTRNLEASRHDTKKRSETSAKLGKLVGA